MKKLQDITWRVIIRTSRNNYTWETIPCIKDEHESCSILRFADGEINAILPIPAPDVGVVEAIEDDEDENDGE